MDEVYLSFLWHMHQPYYKNLFTGEYLLPWVLLHGTKDYYDMAYMLKEFKGLKQNFNLVPSLLIQLQDYEDLDVKDSFIQVFRKPSEELTDSEKIFLLMNFFNANWDNMIKPYPRYYELLRKRGFYYPKGAIDKIKEYFADDELRDIQVLFFLSWIDPQFFSIYEELKFLKDKGRLFSEDDKKILESVQKRILRGIIPLYREYAQSGIIELSTSPFYHPIIPLLIDNRVAREAMPDVSLPERPFSRPEDAAYQVQKALKYFEALFSFTPKGMWPPEGSLSDSALALYAKHGVEWVATDEGILLKSLQIEAKKDDKGFLINPEILYKPYRFQVNERYISIIYRDRTLSDLISFQYSRWDSKEAAADCLKRILKISYSLKGRLKTPLITIAMDGENAWENYKNDGIDFLRYLYDGILKEKSIIPTTISEYLKSARDFGFINHSHSGSWIGQNFSIWLGHIEDNTAWTLLSETRDFLEAEDTEKKNRNAWESIYIAEGSDWFWWYGDEHSSENDDIFDFLFRENLSNVYHFLDKPVPENLSIPIMMEDREVRPSREPVNFLSPIIDGEVTNYFEWIGSGFLEGKGHGTAMHESIPLIKGCYYGFNERSLFLRVDVNKTFLPNGHDTSFELHLMGTESLRISYHTEEKRLEVSLKQTNGYIPVNEAPISFVFSEILEIEIPTNFLHAHAKDTIHVWISLKARGMEVDRVPKRGYLAITVPGENFEMEMWYV